MSVALQATLNTCISPDLNLVNLTRRRHTSRLPSASQLREQLPLSAHLTQQIQQQRDAVRAILAGRDSRLLVVVGPCSLHEPKAVLEYAQRLAELSKRVDDKLLLVMRAYVEKPRTTVGWKGLVYDPALDGTGDMAEGLRCSRQLMLHMLELGLPLATEILQPLVAGYFDDLLSWAAIGARTSESQVHRELVSGLDMPVGFKNGTDGSLAIAIDAMRSAAHPHQHFGVDADGHPALVQTQGNNASHIVLRGGHSGPNYDATSVAQARAELAKQGIEAQIMVDCSHANSGKNPLRQPTVLNEVLSQRLAGEHALRAVMIESHLFDGAQSLGGELRYGVSITDACLGWDGTAQMLLEAAERLR